MKGIAGEDVVPGQIQFKSSYLSGTVLYLYNLYHIPKCLGSDCAKNRYLRNSIRTGATYTVLFP